MTNPPDTAPDQGQTEAPNSACGIGSELSHLLNATHCMDNCDGLMLLPGDSIDLVVTSPPYDDLRTYGGHSWDFFGVAWNLARVLKPGGVIVWVVGDQTKDGSESGTSMEQALHFKRLGLNLHDTMIYETNKPPLSHRRYEQCWEYVFVFSLGKPKTWNPLLVKTKYPGEKKMRGYGNKNCADVRNGSDKPGKISISHEHAVRDNIWRYSTGKNESSDHPAPFPDQLASDHIASWSNKGDIVLDPFMGSGTTAKAAKNLGRHYIGFEINSEYVAICEQRTAQRSLGI